MNKTALVVHWEIFRHLKNKQFIIGLLLTPLFFAIFAGLPRLLEKFDKPAEYSYFVVDHIGIFDQLAKGVSVDNIDLIKYTGDLEQIEQLTASEKRTGYFVFHETFWETGEISLHFKERTQSAERIIQAVLTDTLQQHRLLKTGIDQDQLKFITASATIIGFALEEAIVPKRNEIILSIASIILIFFLIFSSGSMLMQSALQERRDRMAEIMLSSLKPNQLMQGKIIGHFILGLIQLTFWLALSIPVIVFLVEFPLRQALAETNLAVILLFGTLGYLLFSSLFVSMGATMDDLQSAGNSQGLVLMIPMTPFLFISPVINNPNGVLARFAGLFPLTSPVIMVLRNALTSVPLWEIIISLVLLSFSSFVLMRLGGKVFRIGMLMYGKTASFGEIAKWLRYKDD